MLDFIFGVTHPAHWHSINIRQNPQHYSCLSWWGGGVVSSVQNNFGAGIYYNTNVMIEGMVGIFVLKALTKTRE